MAVFFFFSSRRRHTRSTRDWSSDVCSSDLLAVVLQTLAAINSVLDAHQRRVDRRECLKHDGEAGNVLLGSLVLEIGRASCRERGSSLVADESLKRTSSAWKAGETTAESTRL